MAKRKIKESDVFILSSSCEITKGINQSIIIDYLRGRIYTISNEYYDLIEIINRNNLSHVIKSIDESSLNHFFDFLDFMINSDIGLIVDDINQFPKISSKLNDELVLLKDCIIEIDKETFSESLFSKVLDEINTLGCDDLQIRFLSDPTLSLVNTVLDIINSFDIFFVEIHCVSKGNISQDKWLHLIEKYAVLSHIFIYNQRVNQIIDLTKSSLNNAPLLMGNLYYINTPLDNQICGIITKDNLTFVDKGIHNMLKCYNGCLYKKISIDKEWNIKNCPSLSKNYGKITDVDLSDVVQSIDFQQYWNLKKDDIVVCKDCEFRYNCTDCRAFLSDTTNIKSKPKRCKYDPYTNTWSS